MQKTFIQLSMLEQRPVSPGRLAGFHWIAVSTSGGKDSLTASGLMCEQARAEGVLDRVVLIHSHLGAAEWPGTLELVRKQAAHFGVRLEIVERAQGDLVDHIEKRGMFPSPQQRYCTSDHKRAQIRRVYTKLADETRLLYKRNNLPVPRVRLLSCMGMRADESAARAKLRPLMVNEDASNGRREVTDFLPLHGWTEQQVWSYIDAMGLRAAGLVHYAYDLGMPRFSCCFCIFAPFWALVRAGKHNRALLDRYVKLQDKIGHKFRVNLDLHDVAKAVDAGEVGEVTNWAM